MNIKALRDALAESGFLIGSSRPFEPVDAPKSYFWSGPSVGCPDPGSVSYPSEDAAIVACVKALAEFAKPPAAGKPRRSYLEEFEALDRSFSASFWLKKASLDLNGRDPVDAANDADHLAELAGLRLAELVGVAEPAAPLYRPSMHDSLVAVYEKFCDGRPLGSADEHIADPKLSKDERAWLVAYCALWDASLPLECGAGLFDPKAGS